MPSFKSDSIKLFVLLTVTTLISACSSEPPKTETAEQPETTTSVPSDIAPQAKPAKKNGGALISIRENSPADTVLVFYDRLRKKQFRDALKLTNLRPAVEGLSDEEMKDLGVDFGFLAQSVPENMPVNGEIVTGRKATVTVKLPNEESGKLEVHKINLKKRDNNWIVLVADKEGEARALKEGKNYFFALRMDVHHEEAKAMLDRIGKAQMIYSMKNGGKFTSLKTLISKGFVPQDAASAVSTGYNYSIDLGPNARTYTAHAVPAKYGKSGKLSFVLRITTKAQPELKFKDLRGKPFSN